MRHAPYSELGQWSQRLFFVTLFPGLRRGEVVVLKEGKPLDGSIVLAFLWSSEQAPQVKQLPRVQRGLDVLTRGCGVFLEQTEEGSCI